MAKRMNSTLYMESKTKWVKHDLVVERDPDGCLFADGRYRTKILPADLPEWFVYGYIYKRHGYLCAKGVKQLVYKPNYTFDNHLFKDDFLYISYGGEIMQTAPEEPWQSAWYTGYDHLVYSHMIVDFLNAVAKYSDYDVSDIRREVDRKVSWYYDQNPKEKRCEIKWTIS